MNRIYDKIVERHLGEYRQMVFLSGPRQSGKTTIAKAHTDIYLNWDDDKVRMDILAGQAKVAERCSLQVVQDGLKVIAFDEIHKDKTHTGAAHAFQAVYEMPFVERDLFECKEPVVVPARTLFSQLV